MALVFLTMLSNSKMKLKNIFGPTKISHHKLNCGPFLGSGMFDNWREVVLGVKNLGH
jgi:hypothetical protein